MTTHYTGGYLMHNEKLVRLSGTNSHTASDLSKISDITLKALNVIQDTPWTVNPFILDVVKRFEAKGKNVTNSSGSVILRLEFPADPRLVNPELENLPDEIWQAMSDKEKTRRKQKIARIKKAHEGECGEWYNHDGIIQSAHEMSAFPVFYYPCNMDFRTRFYPIPTSGLDFQSGDLGKGLIRFRRGVTLGPQGVYWMAFTLATQMGNDKTHPNDRVTYAYDHLEEINRWVKDPLKNTGWMDTDSPFQCLATAHEFSMATQLPDASQFVSFLPGNLD